MNKKVKPLSKKKLLTTGKIIISEEVDKSTEILDDMKEAVVTICKDYLYNFDGQSKGSTGWFNFDHEFLKRKFSTLEPEFYKKFMKRILKVNIWNHLKRF